MPRLLCYPRVLGVVRTPSHYEGKIQINTVGAVFQLSTRTNIHGSNVIFVRLPDFLHDLLLGLGTRLNIAFDCNGALQVVQRQFLQPVGGRGERTRMMGGGWVSVIWPQMATETSWQGLDHERVTDHGPSSRSVTASFHSFRDNDWANGFITSMF